MMASGSDRPVSTIMSSRLGRNRSHSVTAWMVQARARASGHSLSRRLESNDTWVPASRAVSMASKAVSQAPAEIASEMPDRCRKRGLADQLGRRAGQPLRCHAAGGRVGAQVAELMALAAVGHEIDAGVAGAGGAHTAGVDAFLGPQLQQQAAEVVGADAGQVGGAGAGARRSDGGVAGVAAKALQILGLVGRGLVEFDHGLAQGHHVECSRLHAVPLARWRAAAPGRLGPRAPCTVLRPVGAGLCFQ